VTPPPGIKTEDRAVAPQREQREKKDSWKKKEAKESGSKGTPPQASTTPAPVLPPSLPFRLRPPPYRQEDINAPPRLPTFTPAYQTTLKRPAPDDAATADQGETLDFFRVGDQPFNRKKFRYTPCAAAPDLPQLMYRGIHLPPHRARIDWQDMNPYILIDPEGMTCTTDKGYRMVRTNVCVRSGDWFVEFKVIRGGGDQGGHVRVGFARRESKPPSPGVWLQVLTFCSSSGCPRRV
jgi:COMPASS component BRE2